MSSEFRSAAADLLSSPAVRLGDCIGVSHSVRIMASSLSVNGESQATTGACVAIAPCYAGLHSVVALLCHDHGDWVIEMFGSSTDRAERPDRLLRLEVRLRGIGLIGGSLSDAAAVVMVSAGVLALGAGPSRA